MPRSRNIKPGFFTNGDLLECQPLARILFAGLWTEADCRGILEDRPKTLKIKLLPGDNCDVDELLNELQAAGFIKRYVIGNDQCISVLNFEKHQNPHQNEKPSSLPAPEDSGASTVQAPEQHQSDRADHYNLITDHGSKIPDSINLFEQSFAKFWSVYPRRDAKKDADRAWKKLKPSDDLVETIIADVKSKSASKQWTESGGQFIPLPATYLNGRRWEDETTGGKVMPPKPDGHHYRNWQFDEEVWRWRAPEYFGTTDEQMDAASRYVVEIGQ